MRCGLEEWQGIRCNNMLVCRHTSSNLTNLPRGRVPNPDVRVKTARDDSLAIKGDGIDLAEMALQSLKAAAFRDAPYASKGIVATGYNNVTLNLKASNARLMANENVLAKTSPDIPDA